MAIMRVMIGGIKRDWGMVCNIIHYLVLLINLIVAGKDTTFTSRLSLILHGLSIIGSKLGDMFSLPT